MVSPWDVLLARGGLPRTNDAGQLITLEPSQRATQSNKMASWRIRSLITTEVLTRALSSGHYLGISSTLHMNIGRFASVAPPEHAKPYLSRATIWASFPVSPLRIVAWP